MCKLFPEVGRRARLTRVIGQRGQTRAVIGRGSGLAGAGRGRKLTGTMAATVPLRDRLSFLHRVSAGGPGPAARRLLASPPARTGRLPGSARPSRRPRAGLSGCS